MCISAEMPAVAVTDTNNLFGALEFSEYATAGISAEIHISGIFLSRIAPSSSEYSEWSLKWINLGFFDIIQTYYTK